MSDEDQPMKYRSGDNSILETENGFETDFGGVTRTYKTHHGAFKRLIAISDERTVKYIEGVYAFVSASFKYKAARDELDIAIDHLSKLSKS